MKPVLLLLALLLPAFPQNTTFPYPPQMPGAVPMVYKTTGDTRLNLYVFFPPNHKHSARTPAIVFFFGGGWSHGSPAQFEHHCRHLAQRGMVAIAADYRVSSRHNTRGADSVRDAFSALRYLRANAQRLGIDPNRIAAAGGSAGGHLAASAAFLSGFDTPLENLKISPRPNALVLYNPAVVIDPLPGIPEKNNPVEFEKRMGIALNAISPYHHLAKGGPPTVIFHGRADTTVPFANIEAFARRMAELGNRCEVHAYDNETHGFFNYGRGGNKAFEDTLAKTDAFLVSLGYLPQEK